MITKTDLVQLFSHFVNEQALTNLYYTNKRLVENTIKIDEPQVHIHLSNKSKP